MADSQENNTTPSEVFESIGHKVENLGPAVNGDGAAGAADAVDDQKAVEEIESLCMNCHENVSCLVSNHLVFSTRHFINILYF
jgi:zinc finger protein